MAQIVLCNLRLPPQLRGRLSMQSQFAISLWVQVEVVLVAIAVTTGAKVVAVVKCLLALGLISPQILL
jgi:predicted amidophosphoribosyltransferase